MRARISATIFILAVAGCTGGELPPPPPQHAASPRAPEAAFDAGPSPFGSDTPRAGQSEQR